MSVPYILPLDSPDASLGVAGGKGANLSRLIRAGFPTPSGFIITTHAYRTYLAANGLEPFIAGAVANLNPDHPAVLDAASVAIRARFAMGRIPVALADAVTTAYLAQPVSRMAVAVRSSATVEDLPDLSFAGQQDTFLNVVGAEAVLRAVSECWSSLWTARALGYRARNQMPQTGIALAVVVQTMVEAESAGVLFTANPLNGRRTESVIDAAFGLGEALVSGQVEPDQYVVERGTGRILAKRLGAKGGRRDEFALPEGAIRELARLGERAEQEFGAPQDIEWTWANDALAIVQSRAITSLYPLPQGCDPYGLLKVFASFGAFQGVLDPFTPLGQDALRVLAARVGNYLGYRYTWQDAPALRIAGERLFIDLTPLLKNRFARRLIRAALRLVEPGAGAALDQVLDDPRLPVAAAHPGRRAIGRLLPLVAPLVVRFVRSLIAPDASRRRAQAAIERSVVLFGERAAAAHTPSERLALLHEVTGMARRFMFVNLLPCLAPGMASLNQLYRLSESVPEGRSLALEVTRGLPHNVTTEMDLALWETAQTIRADGKSAAAFMNADAAGLAASYLAGRLPPVAQEATGRFLTRYGMRGPGEIDLGRERWREDPSPVMEALRSYLQITDPRQAPDAVFTRGAAAADEALDRLVQALRSQPQGRVRSARARWAARRVRALAGLRETPKFTIIRLLGFVRAALLDWGAELTTAGALVAPADIFFLHLDELEMLAAGDRWLLDGLKPLVVRRRATCAREARRRQIPRLFLSDGQAFYEGAGAQAVERGAGDARILTGSPVSPGVAEGWVRIVLDPRGAQLAPGEILVCPGTDPSWTPLFLAAGALVMEVGGLMTHGSVVAREYGIPAVVGVTDATRRLHTGQRVRVDGTAGRVAVLD